MQKVKEEPPGRGQLLWQSFSLYLSSNPKSFNEPILDACNDYIFKSKIWFLIELSQEPLFFFIGKIVLFLVE